jgi:BASS family bile acid:Na+ symporter
VANSRNILSTRDRLLLAWSSCFSPSVVAFVLGGPSAETRSVLALGTAQRDISAAFVVAVENFSDPDVVVMLIVLALLGVCIQIPIALALGRRAASAK